VENVYLTPGGGGDAAALCERAAAELIAQMHGIARFGDGVFDGWLGECEEGRGWANLLHEKAVGANSVRWLLERHSANLLIIAEQFRRTAAPYADADREVMGRPWVR
jgi:hypothetical protein